jgi:DNA-binding MarR family transcriptional regulator
MKPSSTSRPPSGRDSTPPGGQIESPVLDRVAALRVLTILGHLGLTINDALVAELGPGLVDNAQILVLAKLGLGDPLRPADVIAFTGMSSGGVTKLLDRLERGGLIRREFGVIPGDRRGTRLALTPDGERAAARCADALRRRLDTLTDAMEQLRSVVTESAPRGLEDLAVQG